MKKILFLLTIALCASTIMQAQKKSDLIAEINMLKSQIDSVNQETAKAKRAQSSSAARAESFEKQVGELQAANAVMMKNLTNFAEVSNKNSDNVNKAMESLRKRENQLKGMTDAIASNDSTAIVVLTNAKQTLGDEGNIGVTNGNVNITTSVLSLFTNETQAILKPEGEAWLGKIAAILASNPKVAVTVEGLNITGDMTLSTQQASAVATFLQTTFKIDANRIQVLAKDGNFKEGINLKLHPNYNEFYLMVKESMKNQ